MSASTAALIASADAAVPVRLVGKDAALEGPVAAWAAANAFTGKPGQLLLVAGADGAQSEVLFGIGAAFTEQQLRGVLRQLIAINAVSVDAQAYNTLRLTEGSRAVLKGEVAVQLRASVSGALAGEKSRRVKAGRDVKGTPARSPVPLDEAAQQRYEALRAWRAEVARAHNLPAYVIFHDATLAMIAQRAPASLDDLQGISGIGAKKLDAYGQEVLRVVAL